MYTTRIKSESQIVLARRVSDTKVGGSKPDL